HGRHHFLQQHGAVGRVAACARAAAIHVADRGARGIARRHGDAWRHVRPSSVDRLRRARRASTAVDPRGTDMNARNDVRAKVLELASRARAKTSTLRDDEVIPETGLLDSAAIMELIVWFETRFDVEIDQGDLTIENF